MELSALKALARRALLCSILFAAQIPAQALQDERLTESASENLIEGLIESPEQRLIAIKQALLDLALGSEIKLASAAYIDSRGVLHESSLLTSDARVRGVRVREYLQEAGIPATKLDVEMLRSGNCSHAKPAIRRQAVIRVASDSHRVANGRIGDHYLRELSELAQQLLVETLVDSQHWAVSRERRYHNPYQSYVSGSSLDNTPYRFDVALISDDPLINHPNTVLDQTVEFANKLLTWPSRAVPETLRSKPWPREMLTYRVQLIDRATDRPLWGSAVTITYPGVARGYAKSAVPHRFQQDLMAETQRLVAEVTERTSCEVNYYRLSKVPGNAQRGQINGGSVAGIGVGDQFLVSTTPDLVNQALRPHGIEAMALAKVVSVGAHTAILQRLAGGQLFDHGVEHPVAMLF